MSKKKQPPSQEEQYTLDDILAEFGNESRDPAQVTAPDARPDQLGVPEDGPDLLPVPEHPPKPETAAQPTPKRKGRSRPAGKEGERSPAQTASEPDPPADWRDNTILFPSRARQTGAEGDFLPAGGRAQSVDELIHAAGAAPEETVEEPTRVLEVPAPQPEGTLAAGVDKLRRKADEFASHMYEGEGEGRRARRAEKLIPGVDREETPHPSRERKPRREAPPPPDVPPAELSKRYVKGLKALRARTMLVFVLVLALGYETLAPLFSLTPLTVDPTRNAYLLASFHILALALGYDALWQGLSRPFTVGMGMDTLVVLANLLALADALTLPAFGAAGVRQPLCAAAGLGLWCVMLGNLQKRRGQRLCCRTAAAAASPYLVTRDEGTWNGRDTYAKWSGPVAGFGSQVQAPDGAERIYRLMSPILLLACVLFALLSSVGRGRTADLVWCLAALLTAAAPLSATLCFGSPWRRLAARLSKSGAALAGWQGVVNTTGGANLLLTDGDLFPNRAVELNGIKIFGDFPIDHVVADTATVIRDSGCGLERVFDQLLRQQGTVYRRGESFAAHEGGGYSEIIRGEQVLVGSAAFMVLMDVPLPAGLKVKNAVFCAIDGELAGIFALGYNLPGSAPEAIDSLVRNKITPVLATRDFNIIPAMLRQRFKLPADKMEFPSIQRRRELSDPDQPHSETLTAVLCREGLSPFAETVVGGKRLRTAVRLSASLGCLGSAVGILLAFYLTFVAAYASLTPLHLLVFLLAWLLPEVLITYWVNNY